MEGPAGQGAAPQRDTGTWPWGFASEAGRRLVCVGYKLGSEGPDSGLSAGGGSGTCPCPAPPAGDRTVISYKEVLIYWRGKKKKDINQISLTPKIIKRINFNKYIFKRFKNISNYI